MSSYAWLSFGPILVLPLAAGCNEARPQAAPATVVMADLARDFDPNTTGTIQGRVHWEGSVPEVPPFKVRNNCVPGKEALLGLVRERPNVPQIDPASKGVGRAVIFLRGIDPHRSRPWNHAPLQVELRDMRLAILQGNDAVGTGFVQRGENISIVSRDKPYHSVHGAGADYFTFMLPEPDQPRVRRPERPGLVELSSASGCYWMRGYLFVDDHPYYTRTDADGRFRLDQIPPGHYELVCWMPNWNIDRQDRDPESCLVTRVFLGKPLEQVKAVDVERGRECTADFTVYAAAFPK